jgi:hypothetical protein
MNATLLCVALLVPGYGEKDIERRIIATGGAIARYKASGNLFQVDLSSKTTDEDLADLCELRHLNNLGLYDTRITDRACERCPHCAV